MKKLTAKELKKLWFKFFEERGHKIIPSASLLPENDGTVLFTSAGMQPLVPFLLGEKHPAGTRIADVQKCLRTIDIDEVGDNSHCTFFEMLGNWSLGDYFKAEMIPWSFEFLTSEDYLGIPVDRLAVSVFAGDENAPRDTESAELWEKCGMPKDKIFFLPKKNNWWGIEGGGPCGPDTEMFFDTGKPKCCDTCSPACDCGKYLEIWNDVFMQFKQDKEGNISPLENKNVDTGMGLERTIATLNGFESVYENEAFAKAIATMETLTTKKYTDNDQTKRSFRIIADHLRAASFLLAEGLVPSNVMQGYVLRRLIRRALNHARKLEIEDVKLVEVVKVYLEYYKDEYVEMKDNAETTISEFVKEVEKFSKTITAGIKEFEKVSSFMKDGVLNGKTAFRLYDTFGFPLELTIEMANEKGMTVDIDGYNEAFKKHQDLSKANAGQVFKGGLSDTSEQTARLHTATHLLQAALRKIVSGDIHQRGSNITPERLRFDFNCDHKLTDEEKQKVEDFVNDAIKQNIPVVCEEMSLEDAKKSGAMGVFENKYGDVVKVYTMGDVSKEICGGPHAKNTGDLVSFKIVKEEASSAGVRRIKATIGAKD